MSMHSFFPFFAFFRLSSVAKFLAYCWMLTLSPNTMPNFHIHAYRTVILMTLKFRYAHKHRCFHEFKVVILCVCFCGWYLTQSFFFSIKSSNLYCCPIHSSICRLWVFLLLLLLLWLLQITRMRSTESYEIVNFIPVTHIASEREREPLLGVCFSFESIALDEITKWFSLFLSAFHFVCSGGFQVKRNPKIIITVNCVKQKETRNEIKFTKLSARTTEKLK